MKDDLTDKMAESYQNNGMPIALKVSSLHLFLFIKPFFGVSS